MSKILVLLTNHATLGEAKEKNGTYAPELTHALHEFKQAGLAFDLASLQGGAVPVYGDEQDDGVNREILQDDAISSALRNSLRIDHVKSEEYDAVFFPGGFGLLYDLAKSEKSGKLTAAIFEQGGVVGAVCHGPAGLLPVTLSDGSSILENITVTGFTREEEVDFGTIDKIPYLLEEALTRKAGGYSKVGPWKAFVVEQDRIITGQNPASAASVGQAMVCRLQAKKANAA